MWLLLIEDEIRLANSLKRGLEESGFTVDVAHDGEEGEDLALLNGYDVLVVDWNLPLQDGKTVIENVRRAGHRFPIIMLSARGNVEDRVAGLDVGADDYLCKPFSFEELLARIHTLLRRPPFGKDYSLLHAGALVLDAQRHSIQYNDTFLSLRPKEYNLLELLMSHPGSVFSRNIIANHIWGDQFSPRDNTIDVTIANLRNKLSEAHPRQNYDDGDPVQIRTIRGVGYTLLTDQHNALR